MFQSPEESWAEPVCLFSVALHGCSVLTRQRLRGQGCGTATPQAGECGAHGS